MTDYYKYRYHYPPNVPPDWLNEDVDLMLREVLDEARSMGSSTVEVDVEEPFREDYLRDLERLGYLVVEDGGGCEWERLATPTDKGREYYRRLDRYHIAEAREREERRERTAHEERMADSDRRARVVTAFIAAVGAIGASVVTVFAGGDAVSRSLAVILAAVFIVAALAGVVAWDRPKRVNKEGAESLDGKTT